MALRGLLEECGREKAKLDETYQLATWEDLRDEGFDGCAMEFAVAPLKPDGTVNWKLAQRDTKKKIYVSAVEQTAYQEAWSARTGKCIGCEGKGEQFVSWNHETGTNYRTCEGCNGTGLAKSLEPVTGRANP